MRVLCDLHARGYGCNEAEELDGGLGGGMKGLNWGLSGGQTLKTALHLITSTDSLSPFFFQDKQSDAAIFQNLPHKITQKINSSTCSKLAVITFEIHFSTKSQNCILKTKPTADKEIKYKNKENMNKMHINVYGYRVEKQ